MKTNHHIPAGHAYAILKQLCNLIPGHVVSRLAKEYGVDSQSRTFTPWSHVVSLLFAQVTHAIGLNDTCDALRMNAGALGTIRGAPPPSRNNRSHASRVRDSRMAEALYWAMMDHLMNQTPSFAKGRIRRGYLRRFHRTIHALDSTTIQLVANWMDWAKHRRRKAAAKCHLRLNLQTFLPQCAIIDTARFHDSRKAYALCAALQAGEIVVFDKAYLDFAHLFDLGERGIHWASRAKDNRPYCVVEAREPGPNPRILRDEIIELAGPASRQACPRRLRRVVALVEVNGKDVEMVFLADNLEWSAWTVAEPYRCRWDIEVFFKEIKQTLQLADFLGYSANAVQWQTWNSFTRLFTVVRAALWRRWCLHALVDSYGTAKPPGRFCAAPEQAYLPGLA